MRISTKGRYGTRAMLSLAARYRQGLMQANEIAEEQAISRKYLENLLATLKVAGLVTPERGNKGGYTLSRSPAEITVYDILRPLEDALDIVHCTSNDSRCERIGVCVTRDLWLELRTATELILKGTTLADLLDRDAAMQAKLENPSRMHPADC